MSRAARLPAIPDIPRNIDPRLHETLSMMKEHLEVRLGARGDTLERAVTLRDLQGVGFGVNTAGSLIIVNPSNAESSQTKTGSVSGPPAGVEQFSQSVLNTNLFGHLSQSLQDSSRFNVVPEAVRNLITTSIANEAKRRGADIRRIQEVVQEADRSMAFRVEEVTASIGNFSAGVRESVYANATAIRSTAGKITQVQARLDDFGGGTATVEETMTAVADRAAGLAAEYMIKVSAGGAVAAIGLAASEDPGGTTESAFVVQADTFAIAPAYNYSQETTPSATGAGQTWYKPSTKTSYYSTASGTGSWTVYTPVMPFGVDTTTGTIYMNGQVRINAGGNTLTTLASNAAVPAITYIGEYASAPSTAGRKKNEVYRNTTNGNSYVLNADGGSWVIFLEKGAAGSNGSNGADGSRGSLTLYATGGSWSDATANATVASVSAYKVIGDTVTISNAGFAATKYWSGTAWVDPGVVINGNLLVTGTISGSALAANSINGKTITGATLQTASSGRRVVTDTTSFRSFDSSENLIVQIGAAGAISGVKINTSVAGNPSGALEVSNAGPWSTGLFYNTGAGQAVYASSSSGYGIEAISSGWAGYLRNTNNNGAYIGGASYGLSVIGSMSINNNTLVSNLNADLLDGYHASSFLLASATAADSSKLGGNLAANYPLYQSITAGDPGVPTHTVTLRIGTTDVRFHVSYP